MYKNNRGAALLQVLMLSALLAGLSVMVLRAALSRQVMVRKTRHTIGLHMAVSACIAEINNMWAVMTPEQYETSLNMGAADWHDRCQMPQKAVGTDCAGHAVSTADNAWYCRVRPYGSTEYCIKAQMFANDPTPGASETISPCRIEYTVYNGTNL